MDNHGIFRLSALKLAFSMLAFHIWRHFSAHKNTVYHPLFIIARVHILISFPDLPANTGGNTFGSAGPSAGFAFGAPNAPSSFNFGAAQAAPGPSTFAFGTSGGGTPAFGASTVPAVGGEFLELVWPKNVLFFCNKSEKVMFFSYSGP